MTKVELTQRHPPSPPTPLIWNKNFTAETTPPPPVSAPGVGEDPAPAQRCGSPSAPALRCKPAVDRLTGSAAPRANSAHPAGNSRLKGARGSAPDVPVLLGRIAASARNSATAESAATVLMFGVAIGFISFQLVIDSLEHQRDYFIK